MGLGDIANLIYKKYKDKYSNHQRAWEEFKNDRVIEALNKYVDYPLYTNDLIAFTERLNKLNYNKAYEIILKLSFLSNHEMIELLPLPDEFFEDN